MQECTLLNQQAIYLISGKPNHRWKFSHREGGTKSYRYVFWRESKRKPHERVHVNLSQERVYRDVWEDMTPINLNSLEAFRGE